MAQAPQVLPVREAAVWQRIRPSIVVLIEAGREVGSAACIDRRGLFIAHSGILSSPVLSARLDSGVVVSLSVRGVDPVTQLVLLATPSQPLAGLVPVTIASPDNADRLETATRAGADKKPRPNEPLIAVLPTGPVKAELSPKERFGVFTSNRRLLPLNEVQFESTLQAVSGALVFNLEGRLTGILSATLQGETRNVQAAKSLAADAAPPLGAAFGGRAIQQTGPGGLTVGYSLAPSVLARVVQGFLSPMGIVRHPSIGVFCKDSPEGGAEVQSVTKGSPAEKAGVRQGDVIVEMGGSAVRDQIDFARIVATQQVGAKVPVVVRRGAESVDLVIEVGFGASESGEL